MGVNQHQQELSKQEVLAKIRACKTLPSLPMAASQVLKLSGSDESDLMDVAGTIEQDAVLSAKLLRAVNSPYHGLSRKVNTVPQAVVLLGMKAVRAHVLGLSLRGSTGGDRKGEAKPWMVRHWRRSVFSASAARQFAGRVMPGRADECFTAALLMDIGALAMDQVFGPYYTDLIKDEVSHEETTSLEAARFGGVTHADASALLAREWGMPKWLIDTMGTHHQLNAVSDASHKQVAQLVWLAGKAADIFADTGGDTAGSIATVRRYCNDLFRVDFNACDEMLREVADRSQDLAEMFDVPLGANLDFDEIVKAANERMLNAVEAQQASLPQQTGAIFIEQRGAVRIRRDGVIYIIPCNETGIGKPMQVKMRDLSANGVGIIHSNSIEPGNRFIIQVPQKNGPTKTFLYTVARCGSTPDGFIIGAKLTSVLKREDNKPRPRAAAAAAPELVTAV